MMSYPLVVADCQLVWNVLNEILWEVW